MERRIEKGNVQREYKYTFTASDKMELAERMAQVIQDRLTKEDEKKTLTSQYKAMIDELTAHESVLSTKFRSGFEIRKGECKLILDFDSKEREYVLIATGEIIGSEPLKPEDYQLELFKEQD